MFITAGPMIKLCAGGGGGGTREEPGTLTQGAPVFPGTSRLGIEPKTPGWLVQDPTTRPIGDLIPTIGGSGAHHGGAGTREEPGTLTQGAPVFPGFLDCRIELKRFTDGSQETERESREKLEKKSFKFRILRYCRGTQDACG